MIRPLAGIRKFLASLRREETSVDEVAGENLLTVCSRTVVEKRLFLNKALSLELLSRELGTNRLYLSKALASSGGFTRYINGFRAQYAAQLMASFAGRTMRISEIAEKSGFVSERGMNYYLVKHCGITAREFRRKAMAGILCFQAKNFSTSFMASGKAKTATRS